jgi:hypothetical protein
MFRKINIYPTLLEACDAVKRLGIKTREQYIVDYRKDTRLAYWPNRVYVSEWRNWKHFLGDISKENNSALEYSSLAEARVAARELGIKTSAQYLQDCAKDPRLPISPKQYYKKEWTNWRDFIGGPLKYPTLVEARAAVRILDIKTGCEYASNYKLDPRLPSTPRRYYYDWSGWRNLCGAFPKIGKYLTLEIASHAVRALGITTSAAYAESYKADPCLPANPADCYRNNWAGWRKFLGVNKEKYLTLDEAKYSARKLGLTTYNEYKAGFRKDVRLSCTPNIYYAGEWISWADFLTDDNTYEKYKTLVEARDVAQQLGFKSFRDYKNSYYRDLRLPSAPNKYYSEWVSWVDFLGKNSALRKYKTLDEARMAVQNLGIQEIAEYRKIYKIDPRLSDRPNFLYEEWISWYDYFGTNPPPEKYSSLVEARIACRSLGFISMQQYRDERKLDPRLPLDPIKFYANEWVSVIDFFLPIKYESLSDVRHAVKVLKIKNSSDYRNQYKIFPPLPAHPERTFSNEWIDWYEFCDIQKPASYEEARSIVIREGITSIKEYRKLIGSRKYTAIPKNPNTVYKNCWTNWHTFFGKEEPFKIKYIREPYLEWKFVISEFLRSARAGSNKERFLCEFIRFFVEKFQLGYSPQDFLIRERIDIRPFKEMLDGQNSDTSRRNLLVAVNEFLEYVLQIYLTEEDDETGELVTVSNARNPLASLSISIDNSLKYSESNKPALAYQYVESVRSWIIPEGARTFSDLTHLHQFEADWLDVDPEILDKNDPDCVWKSEKNKTKVWFPAYWIHTLALVSIPARGRQIAYNDSGEGDSWIPVFKDNQLIWKENSSQLSGSTKEQGFIKRYANDQPGMHFTTNKTTTSSDGYDVPWIPLELVYWLIRFRDWQQKYNPLERPTLWSTCKRTDLNEKQLISKGANCFLFRDYGEIEPGGFSDRLSCRLAAALYYCQPLGLKLAEVNGNQSSLSCFSSKYTPHSMRVSLITAYVMEFGLPIEIIMKVAGHSSIIMSLYYTKTNAEDLRFRFDAGEKLALKNKAYAAQRMIEQGRIDEIKHELVTNSDQALRSISNESPAGTFLFRDYGVCPFAGTRCVDGGDLIGKTGVRQSVPSGYLGSQNCLRCRHFISGPAFVGGLLSLSNEISLHARLQFEHYSELQEKGLNLKQRIDELEDIAYDAEKSGQSFDSSDIGKLQLERRKTCSESESAAQKLDVLMCDIQASAKLIKQCKSIINKENEADKDNSTYLIVQPGHEIQLIIEEPSYFRQLTEVCENAQIYESANADNAIAPRTQLLDKMALLNQINLHLFTLDKKQQLVVGNQLTKLMLSRLRTWERVDALIEGKIHLEDLAEDERISRKDIRALIKSECHLLGETP